MVGEYSPAESVRSICPPYSFVSVARARRMGSQVLSSLCVLSREAWIDGDALRRFILCCQDTEDGGISDKPGSPRSADHGGHQSLCILSTFFCLRRTGDEADIFHTFFGIAGLSLLASDGVVAIDPAHALPVHVMQRLRSKHG